MISKKRNFESTRDEDDYYAASTLAYKTKLTPGSPIFARTNVRQTKMDSYGTKSMFYDYVNTAALEEPKLQTENPTLLFLQELALMDNGVSNVQKFVYFPGPPNRMQQLGSNFGLILFVYYLVTLLMRPLVGTSV